VACERATVLHGDRSRKRGGQGATHGKVRRRGAGKFDKEGCVMRVEEGCSRLGASARVEAVAG